VSSSYSEKLIFITDVDEGSTVTDFLPAERARGITIQSAAITFHWPPPKSGSSKEVLGNQPLSTISHDINLIDTPGHADFTFEVIRSLRVLDGAVCILDGVAGVEAQTEMVWAQAGQYQIPRIMYVNKLDRDGASFARTVKEIAQKLQVWPAVCQIPWWKGHGATFSGVGDAVNLRALLWEQNGDGRSISSMALPDLETSDKGFADELKRARIALVELLSEHDETMVDEFLENGEDHLAISASAIVKSLRKCVLQPSQAVVPVFAGASFRNIGVQPLMDAVVDLLPSPIDMPDPTVTVGSVTTHLGSLLQGDFPSDVKVGHRKIQPKMLATNFQACALAFKVVHDQKKGVLVYVRAYHGSLKQGTMIFNTSLGISERPLKILRMYASDAVNIESIDSGQIGVIMGLKYARTGDTLVCFQGMNSKEGPPPPLNTIQLKPISVPPPVFYASVEPTSLSEEKQVLAALEILLREDPSLHVAIDPESGQTHLSGMGELHLEIACDRLIHDLKAKATIGDIEIGYREAVTTKSSPFTSNMDSDIGGKHIRANSLATVEPKNLTLSGPASGAPNIIQFHLSDNNLLSVHYPDQNILTKDPSEAIEGFPDHLSNDSVVAAVRSGVDAALARGQKYHFPIHSTHVQIHLKPEEQLFMDTSTAAIALATRQAVQGAIRASYTSMEPALLEPVMLATIHVKEHDIGVVVHDLTSARGAQILSLSEDDAADATKAQNMVEHTSHLNWDLKRVYTPPDPFSSQSAIDSLKSADGRMRQISALVPLKEMVGYLKHLRSMTGGRGTFIMQFHRFEPVRGQRLKRAVTELRGV
jgi:elongation factor G